MKYMIIDFEGLRLSLNNFIVKEFAFYDLSYDYYSSVFIKAPHRSKFSININTKINWLSKHLHKINWNYGCFPYKYIKFFFASSDQTTFLVKGSEKTEFIKRHTLAKVINLDEIGCPKYSQLPKIICCLEKHNKSDHCALHKVIFFAEWYKKWNEFKSNQTI